MLADQPTSIPHSLERMKEPNTAPATPPTTSFVDKGYRMTESANQFAPNGSWGVPGVGLPDLPDKTWDAEIDLNFR